MRSLREAGQTVVATDKECVNSRVKLILENGLTGLSTGKDTKSSKTLFTATRAVSTKDSSSMGPKMEKASIGGKMDQRIQAIGELIRSMALVSTRGRMVEYTPVIGLSERCMASGCTLGATRNLTKENTYKTRKRAMANTPGQMDECTEATGKTASSTG